RATQKVTAGLRRRMGGSSEARTAIQAAVGATPRANPSMRCDQRVKRLVYEYSRTMARATGERASVRRLSWEAEMMNIAQETTTNIVTKPGVRVPAGKARV